MANVRKFHLFKKISAEGVNWRCINDTYASNEKTALDKFESFGYLDDPTQHYCIIEVEPAKCWMVKKQQWRLIEK